MSIAARIRLGRVSHAAQHTLDHIDQTLDAVTAPLPELTFRYAYNHETTVGRYRHDRNTDADAAWNSFLTAQAFDRYTRMIPAATDTKPIVHMQVFADLPIGIRPFKPLRQSTIERIRAGIARYTTERNTDQTSE